MSKVRVYELAKELNLANKELIELLQGLGIEAKSHSSGISEEEAAIVKDAIKSSKKTATATESKPKTAEVPPVKKPAPEKVAPAEPPKAPVQPQPPKVEKAPPAPVPVKEEPVAVKEEAPAKAEPAVAVPGKKVIKIGFPVTVRDLAQKLKMETSKMIKDLFLKKIMVTINQNLDQDQVEKILALYDHQMELETAEVEAGTKIEEDRPEDLQSRPPVVTIMGHVDHGKTKLLDYIRKTNIVAREAGGITQHIGAYHVDVNDRQIVFLDTPGHEAFTAMRSRGAHVTDIAVLVVAADDGVMPQTIEAINHAKAAKVPIIVAVNKIDKPTANPDRIMQQLTEYELVPEEWGGSTVVVKVSAMTGQGIDSLLEMILLLADLQELKANPNRAAIGAVIDAHLSKGKGPVATILIQKGTLHIGDNFVVGAAFGKVRAMTDDRGRRVKEAGPSMPMEVTGFSEVPHAGETLQVMAEEKVARQIAESRAMAQKRERIAKARHVSLDSLHDFIKEGAIKELNVIIKADVRGSAEAIAQSLTNLSTAEVKLKVLHSATGDISEADVMLAAASNAIIIAFNVKTDTAIRKLAEQESVEIRNFDVIYQIVDDIRDAMSGLLEPVFEEIYQGRAEVRNIFTVGKHKVIAGCYVTDGKILRNGIVKVKRNSKDVGTFKLDNLKRFKEDVKEVAQGYECGISSDDYNDFQAGDVLELFVQRQKRKTL